MKTFDYVLLGWILLGWVLLGGGFPTPATADSGAPEAVQGLRFIEVGERTGARLLHSTRSFGQRPKAQVLEMFTDGGAAAAVGDFDADGDDDIFVVDAGEGRANHLLRNMGVADDGLPRFVDVASEAGLQGGNTADDICADALWLDYDNDGHLDLLVSRFGKPLLYRNEGQPTRAEASRPESGPGAAVAGLPRFREVSAEVGLSKFGNTIAAIAFDADGDGWLDLLFGNYFQSKNLLALDTPHVLPNNLDYADNGGGVTFWRNMPTPEGDGRRFVEQTSAAGFEGHTGWTLDVGHGDLDGDGDQDVYLAGDYGTDRLFRNRGDGRFEDITESAIGFDTKKGMNVDMADFDRDGDLDIYVTNITDEYMKECNMLWSNLGDGTFVDVSRETGTCDTDWGWAAKFADFDLDGWPDLIATNGLRSRGKENYIPVLLEVIIAPDVDFSSIHTYPDIGDRTWSGYQRQRVFRNLGDGTFREAAQESGMANDLDGRGLAIGDFDGDGRPDVFQTNANQPTLLYLNRSPMGASQGGVSTGGNAGGSRGEDGDRSAAGKAAGSHVQAKHWLVLQLEGRQSNRQAIGARVRVRSGEESWLQEVNGGNGYASASTPYLFFGLGSSASIDAIEVRWPSGQEQTIRAAEGRGVGVDRKLKIREGEGLVP